jgi:ribosomal protein S18 acetylase RimI-like enzyme
MSGTSAELAQIAPAIEGDDLASVARLFREYQIGLGVDLCFQGFDEEIATLPGDYAPPLGTILLARAGRLAAGTVALRPLGAGPGDGPGLCEMKRLYVRPAFRGLKLGRRLAEAALAEARRIGYRALRLDTLATMTEAHALYERLGFRRIEAYNDNPLPDTRYYELRF